MGGLRAAGYVRPACVAAVVAAGGLVAVGVAGHRRAARGVGPPQRHLLVAGREREAGRRGWDGGGGGLLRRAAAGVVLRPQFEGVRRAVVQAGHGVGDGGRGAGYVVPSAGGADAVLPASDGGVARRLGPGERRLPVPARHAEGGRSERQRRLRDGGGGRAGAPFVNGAHLERVADAVGEARYRPRPGVVVGSGEVQPAGARAGAVLPLIDPDAARVAPRRAWPARRRRPRRPAWAWPARLPPGARSSSRAGPSRCCSAPAPGTCRACRWSARSRS